MSLPFASRSRHAAELAHELARFATTELALLLEGETGTGKSFVAARIHRLGRRGRPLTVVDCGAIPATLLPSALFGHRAGAFTDATRGYRGACERAGDGTLVLDRIDALPPEGQAALLRILEERRFAPVGSAVEQAFRARVIALADAGVRQRVNTGAVRADLYHRLAGFHAVLPPLRDRREDILPFAHRVLRRAGGPQGSDGLSAEASRLLVAYPWPGNFRELDAVLTRARLRCDGTIVPADLDLPADGWPAIAALAAERAAPLAEVQRLYALWVLAAQRGNVSRAAAVLGVSRRTLIRWRANG